MNSKVKAAIGSAVIGLLCTSYPLFVSGFTENVIREWLMNAFFVAVVISFFWVKFIIGDIPRSPSNNKKKKKKRV